jgi:hypothetical protein
MSANPTTPNDLVPRTGTFPMPGMEADTAPRKVKVNSQAVVLVIVLGVSAAALASMRHIGMKSGINFKSGEGAPAQPAVLQDDPEKVARYDRIMKDLQQLQQPLDIALGELAKIPALIPSDYKIEQPKPGDATTKVPEDLTGKQNAMRLAKVREAASRLKLQSCMGGKVPLARIDGKFYRIGDLVNEMFIVRSIENRSAVVEAEGETFNLEMQAGKPSSTAKSKK